MFASPMMMKAAAGGGGLPVNLLTKTEQFNNAVWTKLRVSVAADAANAPTGAATADRIAETSSNGTHLVYGGLVSFTSGVPFTMSIHVQNITRRFVQLSSGSGVGGPYANFDLQTGAVGTSGGTATTSGVVDVGAGWYRIFMTFVPSNSIVENLGLAMVQNDSSVRAPGFSGNSANQVYIWGAQVEEGAGMNTYVAVA